jgi:uracil-DNA glycosylase family 4
VCWNSSGNEREPPVDRGDDLRGELRDLVAALKNHVSNGCDSFNPVSRLTTRGAPMARREEERQGDLLVEKKKAAAGARKTTMTLAGVREELGECTRCPLSGTRKNLVFGEGSASARLVFVGEAPGEEEDNQGRPFVGRAGQLLTKIIHAMGLKREDVYICNILKCRPPGNRNPEGDEIAACQPFLFRQIAAVRPRVICALGTFGAQTLLKTKEPISRLRGQFIDFHGAKFMATFHPAYLLRNPNEKRKVWEDVQKIRDYLRSQGH